MNAATRGLAPACCRCARPADLAADAAHLSITIAAELVEEPLHEFSLGSFGVLACAGIYLWTSEFPSVGAASLAATTEAPSRRLAGGAELRRPQPGSGIATTTAPFAQECQSFLDNLIARYRERSGSRDLTDILDRRDRDYCMSARRSRWRIFGAEVCGAGGR
jgi:hypothetical protein